MRITCSLVLCTQRSSGSCSGSCEGMYTRGPCILCLFFLPSAPSAWGPRLEAWPDFPAGLITILAKIQAQLCCSITQSAMTKHIGQLHSFLSAHTVTIRNCSEQHYAFKISSL